LILRQLALVDFAGALMVAHPSTSGVPPAALLAFGAALLGAARDLIGRGVPTSIPLTVVILATHAHDDCGGCDVARSGDMGRADRHLAFLGLAGLCVTFGHFGLLLAYRLGRTGIVAPLIHSFALWGLLSGLIVWGELPDAMALAGLP
jgi:drug/metabolite transporter (DMT)-like permease